MTDASAITDTSDGVGKPHGRCILVGGMMKSDQEMFAEALQGLSPPSKPFIFDRDENDPLRRIHDRFLGWLDGAKTRFAVRRDLLRPSPRIVMGVIDDGSMNAIAIKCDDYYTIGTNVAVPLLFMDLFLRAFAYPDFLSGLGDSAGESGCEHLAPLCRGLGDVSEEVLRLRSPGYPKCGFRAGAAGWFSTLATYFVLLHEFRHVTAGHLDFEYAKHGVRIYSESNAISDRSDGFMEAQAFEWDADRFAVGNLLGLLLRETEKPFHERSDLGRCVPDARRAVFATMLCVDFVITMFLDDPGNTTPADRRDHPPGLVRRVLALSAIKNWIPIFEKEFLSLKAQDLTSCFENITPEVTQISATLSSRLLREESIASVVTDEYARTSETHTMNIFKAWDSIVGELSRYSFVRLDREV
jgi:hypothetical protein